MNSVQDGRTVRKAEEADIADILAIYAHARDFMREHGNPDQWGTVYPAEELILEDVRTGRSYVCTCGGKIECVFCCMQFDDPTYRVIEDGKWLNDLPYAVVHRIASAPCTNGAAYFSIRWVIGRYHNVRIDTHELNIPMQNLIRKLGFRYCGIIYVEDGTPRHAYQLFEPEEISS